MCVSAISAASALVPTFIITIGFSSSAARAASALNRSGVADRLDEHRERPHALVLEHRRRAIAIVSTIASLPVEMMWLRPMFCVAANVAISLAVAPLCETIATAAGDEPHRHHPGPRRRAVDDVDEAEAVRADARHAELAAQRRPAPRCAPTPSLALSPKPAASTTACGMPAAATSSSASHRLRGADEHDRQVDRLADLDAARDGRAPVHHAAVPVHEVQARRRSRDCSKFPNAPLDQPRRSDAPTIATLRGERSAAEPLGARRRRDLG